MFNEEELFMKHQEELFIKDLEKKYIIIDADAVRKEYNSVKPRQVDIILLNDPCGGTKFLNMNLDEEEFERIVSDAEKNNCLFGIWREA